MWVILTRSVFPAERKEADEREYMVENQLCSVLYIYGLQQVVFTALSSKSERFVSCTIFIDWCIYVNYMHVVCIDCIDLPCREAWPWLWEKWVVGCTLCAASFCFRCVRIGSSVIPACSLSVTRLIEMAQTDHACSVNLVYMAQKCLQDVLQAVQLTE